MTGEAVIFLRVVLCRFKGGLVGVLFYGLGPDLHHDKFAPVLWRTWFAAGAQRTGRESLRVQPTLFDFNVFFSNATTWSYELSWSPSWLWRKCNRLLRLGRPWGAVTLSRWCERWYIGRWGAKRGLKCRSTNYPDHGHHGHPPPTRKIPMVEPGIEPGTSWLVVRSSDH